MVQKGVPEIPHNQPSWDCRSYWSRRPPPATSTTWSCCRPCWPRRSGRACCPARPSFTRTGGTTPTATARCCSRWGLPPTSNREPTLSTAASHTEARRPGYSMRTEIPPTRHDRGHLRRREESKRHQLHCRFIRPDNRRRFGKIRAIAWNNKVLNRLRCARMRGIGIPSYGAASRA